MSYCRSFKLGRAVQCSAVVVVVQWVDSSEPRQVNNRKWQKVVAVARAHCTQTSRALSWTQPLFYCYYFFFSKKKKSAHLHRALWFIHRPNKMCAHSRPCRPCTYDIPKVSMRGCYWFCIFWMFDLQLAAATTPSSLLLPSGSSSLLIQKNKEKKKKKKSTVRCC